MAKRVFNNLLVTGGCGFIGANFIRYLLDEVGFGGRIINLDALTYAGNPLSLAGCVEQHASRYVFVHGDIRDDSLLSSIFDEYQIDSVCHFAAESHVDRSIVGPGAFIETNILGTYRLLEAVRARKEQVQLFHHVSTDEVFGSLGETGLFSETTPYSPNSPYSASKASSDHLVRAYRTTYGLTVTLSNCTNNYGPFQFPEKLIPLMILNALEGKALPIYGDGLNVRDWLFVRDHCEAIWQVMESGVPGETYCIGGRNEVANLEVVDRICDLVDEMASPLQSGGPRRSLKTFVQDRAGHDRRYAMDCSKIERHLGWVPSETFESGLRRTVAWYLEHHDWIRSVQTGQYKQWIDTYYANRGAAGAENA